MRDKVAWIGLARSIAWRCFRGQKNVDMITPLALSEEEGLGRWNVSGVFWQIKNEKKHSLMHIDVEDMGFFSPCTRSGAEEANSRRYVTIILNLGAHPDSRKPVPAVPSRKLDSSQHHHPRYAFEISGCSNAVYPAIIGVGERDTYAKLLTPRSLLDEHPRREDDFLSAVLDMKPEWQRGEGLLSSYCRGVEWETDDLNLNKVDPVGTVSEGLRVLSIDDPSDEEEV